MNFLHDSKPPNTGWPSRTNIKSVCCSLHHLLTVLPCLNNNWNCVWGCCTTSLLLFQRLRNFVAAFGSWYGKTFELSTHCWKYPEITLSDQPDRLTRLIYGSTREKFIRFNRKSFIIDIIEPWLRTCVICNSIPGSLSCLLCPRWDTLGSRLCHLRPKTLKQRYNQSETGHGRLQSDAIWIEFSGQACKKEELQRWLTL